MNNYHQKRVGINYHYYVVMDNGLLPSINIRKLCGKSNTYLHMKIPLLYTNLITKGLGAMLWLTDIYGIIPQRVSILLQETNLSYVIYIYMRFFLLTVSSTLMLICIVVAVSCPFFQYGNLLLYISFHYY